MSKPVATVTKENNPYEVTLGGVMTPYALSL